VCERLCVAPVCERLCVNIELLFGYPYIITSIESMTLVTGKMVKTAIKHCI